MADFAWKRPKKVPEIVDYSINWTKWIGTDPIVAIDGWVIPAESDLTKVDDSFTTSQSIIRFSEGVPGTWTIRASVELDSGQVMDVDIDLVVEA